MASWQLIEEDGVPAGGKTDLPGARLRAAREAKGLAVEEVAEVLHLHKRQIEALEQDDYGYFSAHIFVVGYLRNYARILGLDPDPLLAALEPRTPKATDDVRAEPPPPAVPSQPARNQAWLWGAIVAGVLIVTVVWTLSRRSPAPEEATTASAPAAEETAPATEPPPSQPEPQAPPVKASPAEVKTPDQTAVFRFSGDSWIEVADATGKRLTARMGKQGDELKVQGQPPFEVLLGNAANVTVEYNGRPYGNVSANRQNVANFKLGRPGNGE